MKRIFFIGILSIQLTLLSTAIFSQSDYDSATARFKSQDYRGTIEIVKNIHNTGGNTYATHVLCAHAYAKLGDFDSASSHFFQAMKLKPTDPRVRADLIRLYLNHNKTKGALELSTEAIEKYTDDNEIQFLYATTLFRRGKPKSALSRVEKLKSISQNDPELLNLEGKIYFSLENYDKADVSLKWASALDKNSPSIWNNIALVQEKLFLISKSNGKMKSAGEHLKESKESIKKALSLNAKVSIISKNAERILAYNL
jgi:Flp pilus assembly protein TadD